MRKHLQRRERRRGLREERVHAGFVWRRIRQLRFLGHERVRNEPAERRKQLRILRPRVRGS